VQWHVEAETSCQPRALSDSQTPSRPSVAVVAATSGVPWIVMSAVMSGIIMECVCAGRVSSPHSTPVEGCRWLMTG